MLIVASTAVVLVCLTGTAALMGWLPNSTGANAAAGESPLAQPAMATFAAPPAGPATPVVYRQPRAAPMRPVQALACQNCGTVDFIREVSSRGNSNGLGAAGGAVVGGLLGNQVGGGHGREAMTVVGAIGGALAGNQIQKQVNSTRSYETTVHMNDGSRRTVSQETQPDWRDGDHVKIVDGVVRRNG